MSVHLAVWRSGSQFRALFLSLYSTCALSLFMAFDLGDKRRVELDHGFYFLWWFPLSPSSHRIMCMPNDPGIYILGNLAKSSVRIANLQVTWLSLTFLFQVEVGRS